MKERPHDYDDFLMKSLVPGTEWMINIHRAENTTTGRVPIEITNKMKVIPNHVVSGTYPNLWLETDEEGSGFYLRGAYWWREFLTTWEL